MKVGDRVELDGGGFGIITDINNLGVVTIKGNNKIIRCMESSFTDNKLIDQHYDNTNGSLYKFAVDHGLNAYEFDIVKRIVRCRKKGQFVEDLEKTKRVIDLYLKENGSIHSSE